LFYSYDDNWSFYFMPTYQRHFGSFAKSGVGYDQIYAMMGAQLGVKYGF